MSEEKYPRIIWRSAPIRLVQENEWTVCPQEQTTDKNGKKFWMEVPWDPSFADELAMDYANSLTTVALDHLQKEEV